MSNRLKALSWIVAGLGALSLTVWSVWSGAERVPKRYFEAAEQKWRADDYLGAVREYEKITEEYPRSRWVPEAYLWSGVIYFLYLDDPQKAFNSFQNTIRLAASTPQDQNVLTARRYLAEIYEKRFDKPREAIAEYEKIMRESPDPDQVLESHYKIGELYFALGDLKQARTEWDLLVKKDPKGRWAPAALYRQGSTYFVAGDCKEAMEIYRKVFTEYPGDEMSDFAKFRTANCLEEGQQAEEALQLYRELEERYPNKELLADKIKQLENPQRPGVKDRVSAGQRSEISQSSPRSLLSYAGAAAWPG